jgi:hypothetical protein
MNLRNYLISYILGFTFVFISIYVFLNQGNFPPSIVTVTENSGDFTFLGKIIFIIAFPTAIFGLTIKGFIPDFIYVSLALITGFFYGFLIGYIIQKIITFSLVSKKVASRMILNL